MTSGSSAARPIVELDPFDLPDWLGTAEVTWSASGAGPAHLVTGLLDAGNGQRLDCDLLAVDQACPVPVADEQTRRRAHQAWQHGEVIVVSRDDRTTVATPGTAYPVTMMLETLTRLARAVGADPCRWSIRLGLGVGSSSGPAPR